MMHIKFNDDEATEKSSLTRFTQFKKDEASGKLNDAIASKDKNRKDWLLKIDEKLF